MSNKGTINSAVAKEAEEKMVGIFISKNLGFYRVKGEWGTPSEYEKLGLPEYPENWYTKKNACDLVRKGVMFDLKYTQASYTMLSEITLASSPDAWARKDNIEGVEYCIGVVNKRMTRMVRINVTKLLKMRPDLLHSGDSRHKLKLKKLIPGHFRNGGTPRRAHKKILDILRGMGVCTTSDEVGVKNVYRPWDL
jgi:hypothetical protein